jgi:hypothetical protein
MVAATVKMNNCDFLLHSNGEVDITSITGQSCAAAPILLEGKTAEGKFCHIEIGPQAGLKKAAYTNILNFLTLKEITTEFNLGSIKYEAAGSFCTETGAKANGGVETGNVIFSALEGGGAQINYWWE